MKPIRVHGQGTDKYGNVRLGLNDRLDTLQAAILLAKLEIFDQEIAARQKSALKYNERLRNLVEVPYPSPDCTSVWAQYSVLGNRRGELLQKLKEAGIPSTVYYPLPLHLQKVFAHLGHKLGDYPVSERAT